MHGDGHGAVVVSDRVFHSLDGFGKVAVELCFDDITIEGLDVQAEERLEQDPGRAAGAIHHQGAPEAVSHILRG